MDLLPNPAEVAQSPMAGPAMNNQSSDAKRGKTASIALVDQRALSRECVMQSLLSRFAQDVTIEAFASIEDMMSSEPTRFDLMLLYMHHHTGENFQTAIEAIADVSMPVLVITDDKMIDVRLSFQDALQAGICGLVSATDTDSKLLSAAAKFALSGGTFFPSELITRDSAPALDSSPYKKAPGGLTARQAEVFAKLQQGKPNKVIAYELGISESTTKIHIRSIMKTIGATNRTQAVFMGQQRFSSDARQQIHL
jgi:DNA-binding NarL/FixJ family response regulator